MLQTKVQKILAGIRAALKIENNWRWFKKSTVYVVAKSPLEFQILVVRNRMVTKKVFVTYVADEKPMVVVYTEPYDNCGFSAFIPEMKEHLAGVSVEEFIKIMVGIMEPYHPLVLAFSNQGLYQKPEEPTEK
jgi:hypothetical protein